MTDMIRNQNGVAINCFGMAKRTSIGECSALKRWYSTRKGHRCDGCPFFKTLEEYRKGFKGDMRLKETLENWRRKR